MNRESIMWGQQVEEHEGSSRAKRVKIVDSNGNDVSIGSSSYATRFDDAGSSISYIGKATIGSSTSGSVWQIQKMDETGGDVVITWADGDDSFDNIWDNRLSLTYN